jgi:magnesium-transporting ATPase (P-type)
MSVVNEHGEPSGPHRDGPMSPAKSELGPEEIWQLPADRLLLRLATTQAGVATADVRSRLATFGPNDAATVKHSPLWLQFLARFRSPLVIILLVASGLSALRASIARGIANQSFQTIRAASERMQQIEHQLVGSLIPQWIVLCHPYHWEYIPSIVFVHP